MSPLASLCHFVSELKKAFQSKQDWGVAFDFLRKLLRFVLGRSLARAISSRALCFRVQWLVCIWGVSLALTVLGEGTEFLYQSELEPIDARAEDATSWRVHGDVKWEAGYSGKAPVFRKTGASLLLPIGSSDGRVPMNLTEGSVRFRFRPDWNSGEGPGHWASFLSVGAWTPDPPSIGYWALGTNPTGDQLTFSGQRVGEGRTFLRVPIQFVAGRWYDIMLVYSPSSTRVFIDGKEMGPGSGVSVVPSPELVLEYGLRIGNNHHGGQPIEGAIDGFELYRVLRTGFVQRMGRFQLTAVPEVEPLRVRLSWPQWSADPLLIQRRRYGQYEWQTIGTAIGKTQYLDDSPDLGTGGQFEYQVGNGRVSVSVGPRKVSHQRGRVLLVVEQGVAPALKPELERFEMDLVGDGWGVEQVKVPRHDGRRRSRDRKRVQEVRAAIRAFHERAPSSFNVALLVGHVPIPYSGYRAEDGHVKNGDDHRGAWPCDAYYGDLNGVWTDTEVNHSNRTHRDNTNRPGDGRFDQDYLPSSLELAVSRIDFSNLPSIHGKTLPKQPIRSRDIETGLLRRYFNKNHAYRNGELAFAARAIYQNYLPRGYWRPMDENAFRNASAIYGAQSGSVSEEDCFLISNPVQWAFFAGFGGRSSVGSGRYKTEFLNRVSFGPQAAFLMLYASWSADWNMRDSFTKATLTKEKTGLAVMSSLHGQWQLSSLALGEPLARAYFETANEVTRGRKVARSLSILGDATLRNDVVSPVESLAGGVRSGLVHLSWEKASSTDRVLGAYVYRSGRKAGPYQLISGPDPLTEASFTDPQSPRGEAYYMVRQAGEGEGSVRNYVCLSQGRFWQRGER